MRNRNGNVSRKREPLFFVENGFLTELFFTVLVKDTPFASLSIQSGV